MTSPALAPQIPVSVDLAIPDPAGLDQAPPNRTTIAIQGEVRLCDADRKLVENLVDVLTRLAAGAPPAAPSLPSSPPVIAQESARPVSRAVTPKPPKSARREAPDLTSASNPLAQPLAQPLDRPLAKTPEPRATPRGAPARLADNVAEPAKIPAPSPAPPRPSRVALNAEMEAFSKRKGAATKLPSIADLASTGVPTTFFSIAAATEWLQANGHTVKKIRHGHYQINGWPANNQSFISRAQKVARDDAIDLIKRGAESGQALPVAAD